MKDHPRPMKHRTRKILLRFILLPVISLILLVGIAITILYSQQQRLVELAVRELNKQLPGKLAIAGSELSVCQNFPYISIRLQQVQFYDSKLTTARPICEVELVYVGFSMPDLLKQQYHVKAIALKNGHIDLVMEKYGKLNIVEASRMSGDSTRAKDTSSMALDLDVKKVVLKNMHISFLDDQNGQQVVSQIDRIQSSLRDDSLQVVADLQGKLLVDYTHPGDTSLFRHKRLETDIQLSYDKPTQVLKLPVGRLKLEEAVFNSTGTADLLDDNTVDLRITGEKPDLGQLLSFAPPSVTKELKHFRYDGRLAFDGTVKGKLKGGQQPLIVLSFSCANAWLHNKEANKKLDSLAFKGYYTNGAEHSLRTSQLRLLAIMPRPGEAVFKVTFILRNFPAPKNRRQVHSALELAFVGAFLGISDLQRVTAHISLKVDIKYMVDLSLPQQSMSELTQGIQSELTVRDLTFRVPNYPYLVKHLDLHAAMKDAAVKLNSLPSNIGNSDFHLV